MSAAPKPKTKNHLKNWVHPEGSKIKIGEIINSRGAAYFGCSYRVIIPAKLTGGQRVFKQFKEKDEAFTWAEEQWNGYGKQGPIFFNLTDKQKQEAAIAWDRAMAHNLSLLEIIDFALPLMKPQEGKITIQETVNEILGSKLERQKRGSLREASVKNFKVRSGKFAICFGERMLYTLRMPEIKEWLLALELSPRSVKNYRTTLAEVFKYAVQKRYIPENPFDSLSDEENRLLSAPHQTKEPEILTVAEARKLLKSASQTQKELGMLPAITMALFCGVRTEELKRMHWKEVHLHDETPFISIPSTKAKKRRIRNINIPANAVRILNRFKSAKGQIVTHRNDKEFERKFEKLLEVDGWITTDEDSKKRSHWKKNCMRHSFGSYHYALDGDSIQTARLLGHNSSDQVLFDYYRTLASKKEAKRYFAIAKV